METADAIVKLEKDGNDCPLQDAVIKEAINSCLDKGLTDKQISTAR